VKVHVLINMGRPRLTAFCVHVKKIKTVEAKVRVKKIILCIVVAA